MSEWFVYTGTTYYPYHAIVVAQTAAEALEKAKNDEYMSPPIAVFPLSALAAVDADDDPRWLKENE